MYLLLKKRKKIYKFINKQLKKVYLTFKVISNNISIFYREKK